MSNNSQLYQLYSQNFAKNAIGSNNHEAFYNSNNNKSMENLSLELAPKSRLCKELNIISSKNYNSNVKNMPLKSNYIQSTGNS